MNDPQNREQRLQDLLAEQALFDLSPAEQSELAALLRDFEGDEESFERVAALTAVALNPGPHDALPSDLRAKILAAAPPYLANVTAAETAPEVRSDLRITAAAPQKHRIQFREVLAWCAAAACFIFAIVSWTTPHSTARLDSPQATAEFLKNTPDAVKLSWTATEEPAAKGASGEVLWSNAKQKGFLQFKGLAKNDPKAQQYQLWIFDANQDERYPVDGGVFDIDSATGDIIVPINAKLRIVDPKMFAITVEKPGGVVVSDRKHIALLAKKDS